MDRIKIVDLSTLIPGPFSTHLLGKYLGGEVIKFEDISYGDPLSQLRPTKNGIGLGYLSINNKKKIQKVDFRADGVAKIKKEVKDATVFIENFREGKAYKLGLGFDDVKKINKDIIYCSVRGYPKDNPLSSKAAHDLNILSLSGYLELQMMGGNQHTIPPMPLADIYTSYHLALRIAASIFKKQKGVHLRISMYEAMLEALTIQNDPQLATKQEPITKELILNGQYPCYTVYNSKEDKKVAVAALEKSLWIDFCHELKREDLIVKQFDVQAKKEVQKEMEEYKSSYWLNPSFDFCVTPVFSINEAAKLNYVGL